MQASSIQVGRSSPEALAGQLRRRVWLLALVSCTWLYTYSYQPSLHNPNEMVRLYATAALVEGATYQIDSMRTRWGWVNDAAAYRGHFYSVKAPLSTWMAAPGYCVALAISKVRGQPHPTLSSALWWARLTGNVLPMLWFLWWLWPLLRRRVEDPLCRDALWLTLALGSSGFAYSVMLVSHMLAGAAAFVAWHRLQQRHERVSQWVVTGATVAAITAAEYTGVVLSVALSVIAAFRARSHRERLWMAAGALVPTLLVMHMQWACFDNPLSPGHLHLENASFRAYHQRGVFGADAWYPEAATLLLFSSTFGMFFISPPLMFGLVGIVRGLFTKRPTPALRQATWLCVLLWFECAWLSNWRGGWTVGPRYLVPILPLMVWLAADGVTVSLRHFPVLTRSWMCAGLVTGLLLSGVPSAIYPHLPESITHPWPQLLWPALRYGFAPMSVGQWFGLSAGWVWVPLIMLMTAAWWTAAHGALHPRLARRPGAAWLATLWLLLWMLLPTTSNPHQPDSPESVKVARMRGFVLGHWHPAGLDDVAQFTAAHPDRPAQIAAALLAQGRGKDAQRWLDKLPHARTEWLRSRYSALLKASKGKRKHRKRAPRRRHRRARTPRDHRHE